MKVALAASTGAEIEVWREDDLFHARRVGHSGEPQICLGVDLFEVVADLAELDLERPAEAAEAMRLAERAQHRLTAAR